jgi:hypothetical protein
MKQSLSEFLKKNTPEISIDLVRQREIYMGQHICPK